MVVGILELEIRLFSSHSLKDKRNVIKSLISRIRNSFNVSVSEIGCQDLWQKTIIGIAFITIEKSFAERVLLKIIKFVEKKGNISLIDSKMEIL